MKVDVLQTFLQDTGYDEKETNFLIDGFRNGFDLGYNGPTENIRRFAPNLKLNVGSKKELWNKVMKEVKNK